MSFDKEWILALAICSIPFLLFGAAELAGAWRRRRLEAIARRPKSKRREDIGDRNAKGRILRTQ